MNLEFVPPLLGEINNIFGDDKSGSFVSRHDFSKANLDDAHRIMAITEVASICYQSPKALGSESLYNRLMAESHGLPSSSFEFVPMLFDVFKLNGFLRERNIRPEDTKIFKFGEKIENDVYLLTNFRAVVYDFENLGIDLRDVYNTEEDCEIISRHFNVFLYFVDLPTRAQMVRHRVNWQELSRRYVSGERVPFSFYISDKMQNVVSKQKLNCEIEEWCDDVTSLDIPGQPNVYEPYEKPTYHIRMQNLIDMCLQFYYDALDQGIKPQEARRAIPQGMMTQIWGAYQPSQLANFLKMRDDSHAQKEIQIVAQTMKKLLGVS